MNQPIFKNVCVGFGEGVEEVNKFITKFTRKKEELPCPKMEGAPLPPLWPNSGSGWKCNMCRLD